MTANPGKATRKHYQKQMTNLCGNTPLCRTVRIRPAGTEACRLQTIEGNPLRLGVGMHLLSNTH